MLLSRGPTGAVLQSLSCRADPVTMQQSPGLGIRPKEQRRCRDGSRADVRCGDDYAAPGSLDGCERGRYGIEQSNLPSVPVSPLRSKVDDSAEASVRRQV